MSSQFLFGLQFKFNVNGLCNCPVNAADLDSISSIVLYLKFVIALHLDEDCSQNYLKFTIIYRCFASFNLQILQCLPLILLFVVDPYFYLLFIHLIKLNILLIISLILIVVQKSLYLPFSHLFKIFFLLLYLYSLQVSIETSIKNTSCLV